MMPPDPTASAYRDAGVDLDSSDETMARVKDAVTATYTPQVLSGVGAFGGLFDAGALKGMDAPVLVASTDGVGTKTKVAAALGRFDTLGQDLVNHCVNDLLVQGARPLFFLDYVAAARLEPAAATLIMSVAEGCQTHGIPLLGGETAEMPGVYVDGEFDLVGTLVGVVERSRIITGEAVRAGDHILGLPSGGLQTNGFSLARRLLAGRYADTLENGSTVGDALLAPHRSFLGVVTPLLDAGLVRGMAHITGGGLPGNLPRVLPDGLGADVTADWPVPEVFGLIEAAGVGLDEMFRVFNMGVGFVLIAAPEDAADICRRLPEAFEVGKVVPVAGVRVGWIR